MKTRIKSGIGLLLGLVLLAAAATAETSDWQRFPCPKGKLSLDLPAAWKALSDIPGVILAAAGPQEGQDDKFIENLTIATAPNIPPRTMDDFIMCYARFLEKRIDGYRFVSLDEVRIDGRTARKLVFLQNLEGERVKVMQALVMKDEKIYVLNFCDSPETFDRREPDFERMALSLKFE